MKTCYRLIVAILISSFCLVVIAVLPSAAQEKPGNPSYDWLNGNWSGTAPLGGELQLDLRVVDDNKVVGHSRIPMGGSKRPAAGNINGTVNGDQVNLEISYPRNTQNWRFRRKDETLTATLKGEEYVFKKLP